MLVNWMRNSERDIDASEK